eukprot:Platyproteum_vivax@DN4079_c1_g1_i1.p1
MQPEALGQQITKAFRDVTVADQDIRDELKNILSIIAKESKRGTLQGTTTKAKEITDEFNLYAKASELHSLMVSFVKGNIPSVISWKVAQNRVNAALDQTKFLASMRKSHGRSYDNKLIGLLEANHRRLQTLSELLEAANRSGLEVDEGWGLVQLIGKKENQ